MFEKPFDLEVVIQDQVSVVHSMTLLITRWKTKLISDQPSCSSVYSEYWPWSVHMFVHSAKLWSCSQKPWLAFILLLRELIFWIRTMGSGGFLCYYINKESKLRRKKQYWSDELDEMKMSICKWLFWSAGGWAQEQTAVSDEEMSLCECSCLVNTVMVSKAPTASFSL